MVADIQNGYLIIDAEFDYSIDGGVYVGHPIYTEHDYKAPGPFKRGDLIVTSLVLEAGESKVQATYNEESGTYTYAYVESTDVRRGDPSGFVGYIMREDGHFLNRASSRPFKKIRFIIYRGLSPFEGLDI